MKAKKEAEEKEAENSDTPEINEEIMPFEPTEETQDEELESW